MKQAKRNQRRQSWSIKKLNPLKWSWPNPGPALQRAKAAVMSKGKNVGPRRKSVAPSAVKESVPQQASMPATALAEHPTHTSGPRPSINWRTVGRASLTAMLWLMPVGLAAAAFATPLVGAQAYDYIMQTGHFHVRDVFVEGNQRLTYDDIKTLAGLSAGTHLLHADLASMQNRLEAHPWVSRVNIRKELPDRLIIQMTEHKPVAFLESSDGLMLVNDLGEPFTPLQAGEMYDLPIVTGFDDETWLVPARATAARSDVRTAVNLTRLYRSMGLATRWPIAELRVEADRRMTLVVSPHGTEAVLGRGPYRSKLYRLEWVLENLHQQNKVADYVLLDIERGGTDDGRVIVRAEVAPKASELRKEARAHADKAAEKAIDKAAEDAKTPPKGKKQGQKGDKTGNSPNIQGAVDPDPKLKGLLPRMRRAQRDKSQHGKENPSQAAPSGPGNGSGEE